jgi:hypothetical protein
MGQAFEIGTKIFAYRLVPGMIIEIDGRRVAVETVTEEYATFRLWDGIDEAVIPYGAMVELVGFFNPTTS